MADSTAAADATKPQDPLAQIYETSLEDVRQLLSCKVCVRPMYEPYTISCGHTFCYSCLAQWFEQNRRSKTCPECRAPVTRQPAPSYIVREMTRLFSSRSELLPSGETLEEHRDVQTSEAATVDEDRQNQSAATSRRGLFRGCFSHASNPRHGVMDHEDGVYRCPDCHWELEGGFCLNCNAVMMGDDVSFWTDSEDGVSRPVPGWSPGSEAVPRDRPYLTQNWHSTHVARAMADDPTGSLTSSTFSTDSEDCSNDDEDGSEMDNFLDDGHEEDTSSLDDGDSDDTAALEALSPPDDMVLGISREERLPQQDEHRFGSVSVDGQFWSPQHVGHERESASQASAWDEPRSESTDAPDPDGAEESEVTIEPAVDDGSDGADGDPVDIAYYDELSSNADNDEEAVDAGRVAARQARRAVVLDDDTDTENRDSPKEDAGEDDESVVRAPRPQPSRKRRRVMLAESSEDEDEDVGEPFTTGMNRSRTRRSHPSIPIRRSRRSRSRDLQAWRNRVASRSDA